MLYYQILIASQRYHGKESLTYSCDNTLNVGQIVSVPLQNKNVLGIVEGVTTKPKFNTKNITNFWPYAIADETIELLKWMAEYYPAPLGMIVELFTPVNLPKKITETKLVGTTSPKYLPELTSEQADSIKRMGASEKNVFLLHGDTGTGKTRVYIELAIEAIKQGKSAVILTPEIGLTKPLLDTFVHTFGDAVLVTHSDMTAAQRRKVWITAVSSKIPLVIIGPRSAIFTPLRNIGLIVIDEAHDTAYKQEQAPHYQTTRVAAKVAQIHNAKLILGSATPSVIDYYTFLNKNLPIIRMTTQAVEATQHTSIDIIDQRDKSNFTKSPWLANKLITAIEQAQLKNEQTLLFLNRRGSARLVMCDTCGWQAMCPHCDVPLTYHHDSHLMICHSCDYSGKPPTSCPACSNSELIYKSIGTKALEAELLKLFPRAKISRFDRDTVTTDKLQHQYESLRSGETDILIGTQSIVKGFDLPNLSVVGVVQADSGMQIPDYTAAEKSFQLISQVSGRIGRGHRAGSLFVQTYDPESSLIKNALERDYNSFYENELSQRQLYLFPPFVFILKIVCIRSSSNSANQACEKIKDIVTANHFKVKIEGPTPRYIEKIGDKYAWQLIIKSKDRQQLTSIIKALPSNCTYDLDPSDLL